MNCVSSLSEALGRFTAFVYMYMVFKKGVNFGSPMQLLHEVGLVANGSPVIHPRRLLPRPFNTLSQPFRVDIVGRSGGGTLIRLRCEVDGKSVKLIKSIKTTKYCHGGRDAKNTPISGNLFS